MNSVLGIDPGFAALGWARVAVSSGAAELLQLGCIRTEKGVATLRASEDNVARARLLHRALTSIIDEVAPRAIAIEAQSWPRNAGATAKLGIAWGVVVAIAAQRDLPIVQVTPQALKLALVGTKTATKEEVLDALRILTSFSNVEAQLYALPKALREHPVDAAAAVLAAYNTEIMLAIRGGSAEAA